MTPFLKQHYGPTEGPLGFPQTDKQAQALDALLKALPSGDKFRYRKAIVVKATTELSAGERADVSWISTEDPDRTDEVVMARGMNDSQFALNPIVTLNHCYWAPPAGKSLWRKRIKATDALAHGAGIKAKTHYPSRPDSWPKDTEWIPDLAFSLVQSDLLRGKSIGFLPTRVHVPTASELDVFSRAADGKVTVNLVIDEWLLLEYACVFLPAQQHAVVEQVSKSLPNAKGLWQALGIDPGIAIPVPVPHCRLETIAQALERAVDGLDFSHLAEKSIEARLDRRRGRI